MFAPYKNAGLEPARVISEHRTHWRIITSAGEMQGSASGKLRLEAGEGIPLPAVGDWVAVELQGGSEPHAVVHLTLPRKSKFSRSRPGASGQEQIVAANIDIIFIVAGLDGDYNPRRIERYLSVASNSGASPIVILNKADLCDDVAARVAETRGFAPEVSVLPVSAKTGDGIDAIAAFLEPGSTSAFLGSSGVGKSSIINRLLGTEKQKVNEVREADSRGRHTTSHRELFFLPSGAMVIDTPGMRELQLPDSVLGVREAFDDIETLSAGCRFTDCSHQHEPHCAVLSALASGDLERKRYDNYLKLLGEERFEKAKEDTSLARAEKARWRVIHKAIKKLSKK